MESKTPEIPTATLKTISLRGLLQDAPEEAEKLVSAAKEDGIFYVDFKGDASNMSPGLLDEIYSLSRSLFDLSIDEKMRYDIDKIGQLKLNGYKPISRNVGGVPGQRDGFESYALPRNGIFSLTKDPFPRPSPVDENWNTLRRFTCGCQSIAELIFATLSKALKLPTEKTFESFHCACDPSLDIIRLLKYQPGSPDDCAPRVPQTAHTDLGSLTMLFASSPGLQICPKGSEEWFYVMPQENSFIVNLGDAMSIWTEGMLQSVLHRVASMPAQAMNERYSFAFLMRPADEAPITSLLRESTMCHDADVLRCADWVREKFLALRGQQSGDSEKDKRILAAGRDRV